MREISLREIADATKINLRYLEALEQNRFDVLPGGVFNKGFIRAYATFIGVDGEALVDSYLQEVRANEPPPGANGGDGLITPSGHGATGMHRPLEAPRRRAGDAAPVPATPLGITFAESTTPRRSAPAAVPAQAAEPVQVTASTDHGSRAPVIIGSLMVATGVVFALLMMMSRSPRGRTATSLENAAPSASLASQPNPPTDASADPGDSDSPLSLDGTSQGALEPHQAAAPGAEGPIGLPASSSPAPLHDGPRAPQPSSTRAVPPPAAVPPSGMDLRIEATAPVLVQAFCDGEDRLNRTLAAGDVVTMHCLSLIRISATDAGAVRLSVNGARCAPLGEPGGRVEGFSIRIDDFRSICPVENRGDHAGR